MSEDKEIHCKLVFNPNQEVVADSFWRMWNLEEVSTRQILGRAYLKKGFRPKDKIISLERS